MAPKKKAPKKADKETKELELAASQVRKLLKDNWSEIRSFREKNLNNSIKVGFSVTINESGPEIDVGTGISFSLTRKDSIKNSFDPNQDLLPLDEQE